MGRLKGTDRRRRIIEEAIALFSDRGFRGSTTRELARRARISEALLFRHFPTKKRLYQAILQARMEEQVPALLEGLSGKSLGPLLVELSERIVRHNEQDPSFLRLLLFSALEGHSLSDLFFQRRTLPLLDFLSTTFEREIRTGRLRRVDPVVAARAFLALVFGFVQTRLLFRIREARRRPARETLRVYVGIFLRGLEAS